MRSSLAPVLLAAILLLALALAPRAEAYVYWTETFGEGGRIGRANLDGTGVDSRFITGAGNPGGVAVDARHIYWANWKARAIGRANLDGTGIDKRFITGARNPLDVAVDAAHVYWSQYNGTIGGANLDGTGVNPTFITSMGTPWGVAVDAAHVYWSGSVCDAQFGCVDTIARASLDGSDIDRSFIPAGGAVGLALDAAHAYWSSVDPCDSLRARRTGNSCALAIGRANLDGTGVDPGFIAVGGILSQEGPQGVAVDDAHVYWANYSGSRRRWNFIGRANIDGTGAEHFITGTDSPSGVAVDALRSFSFGKVKKNKRKGTAKLAVKVAGPGIVKLAKTESVRRAKKRAEAKGKAKLSVRPKGKAKQKLAAKGRATVKANVAYRPRGGDPNIVPNTDAKTVKLVKR